MARIATRTLRTTRMLAALFTLIVGFVIATTATSEKGWHFGDGWFVSFANATLQVGLHRGRLLDYDAKPPGPYTRSAYNTDFALAWRPFHARGLYSATGVATAPMFDWQFIVVPLWPLAAFSLALTAYAHGRLTMLRDIRSHACVQCGYDLAHVPKLHGSRVCPECGGTAATLPTRDAAA